MNLAENCAAFGGNININGPKCWFLDAFAKLRKATVSFVMPVCLFPWNNWTPTERVWIKFDIGALGRGGIC